MADACDQIDVNLIYDQSVKFMTRLGKFTEGKQCPLLVGFNDPRVKRNILEKASNLRSKRVPSLKCSLFRILLNFKERRRMNYLMLLKQKIVLGQKRRKKTSSERLSYQSA